MYLTFNSRALRLNEIDVMGGESGMEDALPVTAATRRGNVIALQLSLTSIDDSLQKLVNPM
jgi:hypothetical protein